MERIQKIVRLLLGIILTATSTNDHALAITRDEIMTIAQSYASLTWNCSSSNANSYYNYFVAGSNYTGVAYNWGGYDTVTDFLTKINNGAIAGDSKIFGTVHSDFAGVDCSGYVSRCWGCGHYTTRGLPSISSAINWTDLKKGDIINWAGHHVRLFSYFTSGTNQMVVYESTIPPNANPARVVMRSIYRDNNYTPRKYVNIEENQIPSPPTPISPGSSSEPGPIIGTLTPVLQWNESTGADYYAIGISEYPYGPSHLVYNPQQVYGSSHQVPSGVLEYGKKYRWNMQARNSAGLSAVSNTLYFQTPLVLPDLIVEDIWINPEEFSPGQNVNIYARIKNIGETAAGGFELRVYFDGVCIITDGVEGLGANYSTTLPSPWSYTWPSNSNSHVIRVVIDSNNDVVESNESNNERSESFSATQTVTLTVNGSPSQHDSPNPSYGSHQYNQGATVSASVSSPTDESNGTRYRCTGYSGTGSAPSGSGERTSFTINQNSTLTWKWKTQYRLQASSAGNGSVSPSGTNWYDSGYSVTLNATPNTNYQVDHWTVNGNTTGNGQNSIIVTMNEPKTVVVYFVQKEAVSTPNTPSGPSSGKVGQSLTFSTGGSSSNLGHSVEYQFDWGDGTQSSWGSSTRSHSYSGTGTKYVKARARCQTHTSVVSGWSNTKSVLISYCTLNITVSPSCSGSVSKSPNKTGYSYNESVQLTANASSGYRFDHWGGDLSGSDNPENIKMSGDKSVTAYFHRKTGSLTVIINPSDVRSSARWRLTSGPYTSWKKSEDTIYNIPTGAYTLQFNEVTGWDRPDDMSITINEGADTVSITYTGVESEENKETPSDFVLYQNYPNPFNSETIIQYQIPIKSWVIVKVLNLSGEEIRTLVNGEKQPGYFSVTWDAKDNTGRDVPSGIYIYVISAENLEKSMKMLLIR